MQFKAYLPHYLILEVCLSTSQSDGFEKQIHINCIRVGCTAAVCCMSERAMQGQVDHLSRAIILAA